MTELSLHTFLPFMKNVRANLAVRMQGRQKIQFLRFIANVENSDFAKISSHMTAQLSEDVAAWCVTIDDALQDKTTFLLTTKDFHLIQTVKHRIPADVDIISAVTDFLSFQNDGTITQMLIDRDLHITTMESCTSGLIASNITDYEGSSSIFKGAHITYSNEAKIMAGVDKNIIDACGVYSPETAAEMARNAKMHFHSDIAIGVTGSFSNVDPANPDSVAGEVHYQILMENEAPIQLIFHNLDVSRKELKQRTVDIVLATLYAMLKNDLRYKPQ